MGLIDNHRFVIEGRVANTIEGHGVWPGTNTFHISRVGVERFVGGSSANLDPRTEGWGMNVIHEMLHTKNGGNYEDDMNRFGSTGYVTDFSNIIRAELGQQWGQRLSYLPMPVGGYNIYPYDNISMQHLLNQDKLPLNQRTDPPSSSLFIIYR